MEDMLANGVMVVGADCIPDIHCCLCIVQDEMAVVGSFVHLGD
jgi:hypothetical protein